ncbi:D-mandelate dehydrogenase [Aspergillus luchuensis IFO 4308]|nr:D-mandelate dehydrogenase [Aspergillus luchuensis IFO 4308]
MTKPIILHLGDPIAYNHDLYNGPLSTRFTIIRDTSPTREAFIEALKSDKYGPITALLRPHFSSGKTMSPWDTELISLLPPSVKIFASAGAGYNDIHIPSLTARGIYYTNGAGASDEAVADTTLYMILSVFRNFTASQIAARSGDEEKFMECHKNLADVSVNPRGKVLGLIGLGRIGSEVVRKEGEGVGGQMGGWVRGVLEEADCVSVHCPLNEETRGLIDGEKIGWMKHGVRIVNVARGGVVVEEDLVEALRSGKVAAAALDVHEFEPVVDARLRSMENVTLTTHVGGGAVETRIGFERLAMENILKVTGDDGEVVGEPLTAVNGREVKEVWERMGRE